MIFAILAVADLAWGPRKVPARVWIRAKSGVPPRPFSLMTPEADRLPAYGNQNPLPRKEFMLPALLSPYAVAEMYRQSHYQVFGLETVALRYFNIFGPRQAPDKQGNRPLRILLVEAANIAVRYGPELRN